MQDLRDIRRHYARVALLEIAENILRRIDLTTRNIAERPFARRSREEVMPGLRSALVRPFTVFFRITGGTVEIVRVRHERRDFPAALEKESE